MVLVQLIDIVARIALFAFGAYTAAVVVMSALRTFALPRSANVWLTRMTFRMIRNLFDLRLKRARSYETRDQIMALYAPVSLFVLPMIWLGLVIFGFTLMFWAMGLPLYEAFRTSGSSLLTLGFSLADSTAFLALEFIEAALGMILVALLIAYLPTMYAAFSRRETVVSMLEVRAGSPPSPAEMLARMHSIRGLNGFDELWLQWEVWFVEIEESHTSLAALTFFRSPKGNNSWVTAAGTILDTAALYRSTIEMPRNPQIDLTIRAGFIALRSIADFFRITYDSDPRPDDPISIARDEFDQVYDQLKAAGIPLKADRDQAWRDYAGWRVNYDRVLLALAELTIAPYAMWVSDRGIPVEVVERVRRSRLGFGVIRR
jgi:hypothetical protein